MMNNQNLLLVWNPKCIINHQVSNRNIQDRILVIGKNIVVIDSQKSALLYFRNVPQQNTL